MHQQQPVVAPVAGDASDPNSQASQYYSQQVQAYNQQWQQYYQQLQQYQQQQAQLGAQPSATGQPTPPGTAGGGTNATDSAAAYAQQYAAAVAAYQQQQQQQSSATGTPLAGAAAATPSTANANYAAWAAAYGGQYGGTAAAGATAAQSSAGASQQAGQQSQNLTAQQYAAYHQAYQQQAQPGAWGSAASGGQKATPDQQASAYSQQAQYAAYQQQAAAQGQQGYGPAASGVSPYAQQYTQQTPAAYQQQTTGQAQYGQYGAAATAPINQAAEHWQKSGDQSQQNYWTNQQQSARNAAGYLQSGYTGYGSAGGHQKTGATPTPTSTTSAPVANSDGSISGAPMRYNSAAGGASSGRSKTPPAVGKPVSLLSLCVERDAADSKAAPLATVGAPTGPRSAGGAGSMASRPGGTGATEPMGSRGDSMEPRGLFSSGGPQRFGTDLMGAGRGFPPTPLRGNTPYGAGMMTNANLTPVRPAVANSAEQTETVAPAGNPVDGSEPAFGAGASPPRFGGPQLGMPGAYPPTQGNYESADGFADYGYGHGFGGYGGAPGGYGAEMGNFGGTALGAPDAQVGMARGYPPSGGPPMFNRPGFPPRYPMRGGPMRPPPFGARPMGGGPMMGGRPRMGGPHMRGPMMGGMRPPPFGYRPRPPFGFRPGMRPGMHGGPPMHFMRGGLGMRPGGPGARFGGPGAGYFRGPPAFPYKGDATNAGQDDLKDVSAYYGIMELPSDVGKEDFNSPKRFKTGNEADFAEIKASEDASNLKEGDQDWSTFETIIERGKGMRSAENRPYRFVCCLCKRYYELHEQVDAHVAGADHAKKLEEHQKRRQNGSLVTDDKPTEKTSTPEPTEVNPDVQSAETLDVEVETENGAEVAVATDEAPPSSELSCDVCSKVMNSVGQYETHLNSKKHQEKVAAKEAAVL